MSLADVNPVEVGYLSPLLTDVEYSQSLMN